eukprot:Amastigsp_a677084_5.p3 type:complete len:102 gc:universal Amastigsp_a677084_5:3-308(+)
MTSGRGRKPAGRKTDGFHCAARAIMTAAHPVASLARAMSACVKTSPLRMTGTGTARTISAIWSQIAGFAGLMSRVRPWTARAAIPVSHTARANASVSSSRS